MIIFWKKSKIFHLKLLILINIVDFDVNTIILSFLPFLKSKISFDGSIVWSKIAPTLSLFQSDECNHKPWRACVLEGAIIILYPEYVTRMSACSMCVSIYVYQNFMSERVYVCVHVCVNLFVELCICPIWILLSLNRWLHLWKQYLYTRVRLYVCMCVCESVFWSYLFDLNLIIIVYLIVYRRIKREYQKFKRDLIFYFYTCIIFFLHSN